MWGGGWRGGVKVGFYFFQIAAVIAFPALKNSKGSV